MSGEGESLGAPRSVEGLQKRLLRGELSPAEYASLVVGDPSLRRASRLYERHSRHGLSSPHPLVRARVFLALALISGLFGIAAIQFGWFGGLAFAPGLAATAFMLLTAFFVVRSSAAQEIWLLNHELRRQRSQVDAFEAYGEHLERWWSSLAKELSGGEITAGFIRERLERTRVLMETVGSAGVALAILRRETERYFVAYTSVAPGSMLEAEIDVSSGRADELFHRLDREVFTQSVPFRLSAAEHELVALSEEPFGRAEQWLLSQIAAHCSTAGALSLP